MLTSARFRVLIVAVLACGAAWLPLSASENIDYGGINKIKEQGLNASNSKVMEIMSYLTDVYGPRLTGSPNVKKAGDWVIGQMKEWGLVNVALEPWTPCPSDMLAASAAGQPLAAGAPRSCRFPRGWQNDKFYVEAVAPQAFPIPGTPTGWTPGTNGLVRGEVVLASDTTLEALKSKSGSLRGKWVLRSPVPDVAAYWTPLATRETAEELAALDR